MFFDIRSKSITGMSRKIVQTGARSVARIERGSQDQNGLRDREITGRRLVMKVLSLPYKEFLFAKTFLGDPSSRDVNETLLPPDIGRSGRPSRYIRSRKPRCICPALEAGQFPHAEVNGRLSAMCRTMPICPKLNMNEQGPLMMCSNIVFDAAEFLIGDFSPAHESQCGAPDFVKMRERSSLVSHICESLGSLQNQVNGHE